MRPILAHSKGRAKVCLLRGIQTYTRDEIASIACFRVTTACYTSGAYRQFSVDHCGGDGILAGLAATRTEVARQADGGHGTQSIQVPDHDYCH